MNDPFGDDGWDSPGIVHAGGGVIARRSAAGVPELLLVHRPKYDDWTLPKGKLSGSDESGEAAALREVEEETGLRCRLLRPLGSTRYVDHKGRDKVARYWEMAPESGSFTPSDEVDEVRWLEVPQALALLSYEHDQALVRDWEPQGS